MGYGCHGWEGPEGRSNRRWEHIPCTMLWPVCVSWGVRVRPGPRRRFCSAPLWTAMAMDRVRLRASSSVILWIRMDIGK